jgi:hypothetical protein
VPNRLEAHTHTPSTSFAKSTIHRYSLTTLLYLFAEDSNHRHLLLRRLEALVRYLRAEDHSGSVAVQGNAPLNRTTRRRYWHNTRRTNQGGCRICLGGRGGGLRRRRPEWALRHKEARGGRAEAGSKEFERVIRMVHTRDGSAKPGFHSIQQ